MIVFDSACVIAYVIFILQVLLTYQISLIILAHVVNKSLVIIANMYVLRIIM